MELSNDERKAIEVACESIGRDERCGPVGLGAFCVLQDLLTRASAATAASRDVLAERQRQINVEGWTFGHDDSHTQMEMAEAAAVYALEAAGWHHGHYDVFWPWTSEWFKPTDRRRDLVKAGALILAEIERLDRVAQKGKA